MLIAALIATLVLVFMPRSSALYAQLDQVEERIEKDVSKGEQRKEALAIVDKMKSARRDQADTRKKTVDALVKLLQKRESSAEEIAAAARPLDSQDLASAEQYLDLRFELTKVLTKGEWTQVFPAPGSSPTQKIEEAGEEQKP